MVQAPHPDYRASRAGSSATRWWLMLLGFAFLGLRALAQPFAIDLGTLSPSQPVYASSNVANFEVLWYRFCVNEPQCAGDITLEADTSGSLLEDTEIGLYSSIGTLIAYDDDGGSGLSSLIQAAVAPGCYYLAVAGYDSTFSPAGWDVHSHSTYSGSISLRVQLTASGSPAPGPTGWIPGIGSPGLNSEAYAMTVWDDDGAGPNTPQLIVAGNFTVAGGSPASRIAKWNGATWSALGAGILFNNTINALAVFDEDGAGPNPPRLFAAGQFTIINQPAATAISHIARWNGTAWVDVGPPAMGINGFVPVLYTSSVGGSQALYAGGIFTSAGGVPCANIAKWNGSTWSPLGLGTNLGVYAMKDFNPGSGLRLYVGGIFTTADASPSSRIASWSGTSWAPLGTGLNGNCWALTTHDDGAGLKLYAGGAFTSAGGAPASHLARWSGAGWSSVSAPTGEGTDQQVFALASFDAQDGQGTSLYAGGDFAFAGSLAASRLARWNCGVWSPMNAGADARVYALAPIDAPPLPRGMYVAGNFVSVNAATSNRVARWHGPDCNGNGIPDGLEIACGSVADCNANCIPDSCDIASGFSQDCNRTSVPDECEPCGLLQSRAGPGDSYVPRGTNATAWKRSLVLKRGWWSHPGPWYGIDKSALISWRNLAVFPSGSSQVYQAQVDVNISAQPQTVEGLHRTNSNHQNCTGKKTYKWVNINEPIMLDHGMTCATDPIPDVHLNMNFKAQYTDLTPALVPLAKVVFDIIKCIPEHFVTVDCWKNLILDSVDLVLKIQSALDNPKTRGIGELDTILSSPAASTGSCLATADEGVVKDFELSGIGDHSAHVQIQWDDDPPIPFAPGPYYGCREEDADNDSLGGPGEEATKFSFAQLNGWEYWFDVLVQGPSLAPFGANQSRTVHYLVDTDNTLATGDQAVNFRGADYDIRVRLVCDAGNNFIEAYSSIWTWCGAGWVQTSRAPHRTENLDRLVSVTVGAADIGVCSPGHPLAAWLVIDHNGSVVETIPNLPDTNRLVMQHASDQECPKVFRVSLSPDPSSLGLTSVAVWFTEPVRSVTAADTGLTFMDGVSIATNVQFRSDRMGFELFPASGSVFPGGHLLLRVLDSVMDLSDQRLNGDETGGCGGNYLREICAYETRMTSCDSSGAPQTDFADGDHVYVSGTDFVPGNFIKLFVVLDGTAEALGDPLIDQTLNGAERVRVSALGNIGPVDLGVPNRATFYDVVADVNQNGLFDPSIDRVVGTCTMGFSYGAICENGVEDIMAYWPFDEAASAGSAAVDGVGGATAFYDGAPVSVPGAAGNALQFGPSDSAMVFDAGEIDFGATDFTIEFWILKPAPGGSITVLDKRTGVVGYNVSLTSSNIVVLTMGGNPGPVSRSFNGGSITPGSWHHVAVTVSRTAPLNRAVKFYIDGSLAVTHANPVLEDTENSADLQIMAPDVARSACMLDELAFFDRAITAEDVALIYNTRDHCVPTLVCPDCAADFNSDGGVDGSDVEAFFFAWEVGEPCADVNQDGGVDGADVEFFFFKWEIGGCF